MEGLKEKALFVELFDKADKHGKKVLMYVLEALALIQEAKEEDQHAHS